MIQYLLNQFTLPFVNFLFDSGEQSYCKCCSVKGVVTVDSIHDTGLLLCAKPDSRSKVIQSGWALLFHCWRASAD